MAIVNSQVPYEGRQPLSEPLGKVLSTDISDANDILVNGGYDDIANVYTWNKNSSKFEHSQSLTESNDDVENVKVTGDGKFILVTDYSGRAIVYKKN